MSTIRNKTDETVSESATAPQRDNRVSSSAATAGHRTGDDAPSRDPCSTANGGGAPNTTAGLGMEELYLQCKFSALFVLAVQKQKPVVYIDEKRIMQDLDTFVSGYVREDGCTSRLAPARNDEGVKEYERMRERMASKLAARILKRSDDNFAKEAKNRMVGANKPEHGAFSNVTITPEVFKAYCQMRNTPKFVIDADYPEKCPQLWKFLSKVVAAQYDFEKWTFVSPKAVFNQNPVFIGEDRLEEFQVSTDYPDRIFAFLQFKLPGTDQYWSEIDVFDDLPAPVANKRNFKKYSKKEFPVYFHPDPDSVTVPERKRGKTYTAEDPEWVKEGRYWIRKDDGKVWKPKAGVRMFDAKTGEYLQYRHIDFECLKNVDPNDLKGWKKYYNGFWRQLLNRDLKQIHVTKDSWTKEEKIVVYMHINAWCKENGVDAWSNTPFSPTEVRELNKQLHQVREKGRTRSSIVTWIAKRVNNLVCPIGILASKAIAMRERMQNGEEIPDDERFPNQAIPLFDEGEQRKDGVDDGGDDGNDSGGEDSDADDDSSKKRKRRIADDPSNYALDKSIYISDHDAGDEDVIDKFFPPAAPSKKRTHDGGVENAPARRPRFVFRMPVYTQDEEEERRLVKEHEEQGRLFEEE